MVKLGNCIIYCISVSFIDILITNELPIEGKKYLWNILK